MLAAICSINPCLVRAEAWKVERLWNAQEEKAFSDWVTTVGEISWRSINHLICDGKRNHLYEASDRKLQLYADCADLPVMLRAYYAYKRRLPFAVTQVDGGRYTRRGNRTVAVFDNLSYEGSSQDFLRRIPELLHSGCYRTEPDAKDSLTYPLSIEAKTIRPGAIFYSPEGHVGIVSEVTRNGEINLLDGHPDETLTRIRFSPKLPWKSTARVGGFRAFRPVEVKNGKVVLASNNERLPGYSAEQYGLEDYYGEVRNRLSKRKIDPLKSLEATIREDIYAEVLDRVESVELGWEVGRQTAIPVPPNIYTAEGNWEAYATPSRDLRLRRAILQLPEEIRTYLRLRRDAPSRLTPGTPRIPSRLGYLLLKRKDKLFRELNFSYKNSLGQRVSLSLADLEKRLFRLSFDPNHPPELRWGATGSELAIASRRHPRYYHDYARQQPWRDRLEKKRGLMSPSDPDNPSSPPAHDISALIEAVIHQENR